MEDGLSSELDSYLPGTIVWVKLPRFSWWPAEVVAQRTTEGKAKRELEIKTYGDSDEESMNFIKSPKMIKLYTCSEQKKFTEIGKKKYQNSPYHKVFDDAIDMANKNAGIEEVIDTVEQTNNQYSPQTGNFEIRRRNSTSTSNVCSYPKDGTPPCEIDYNNQHVELTSTPISGSTGNCDSEIMLTPTCMETPSRSVKRLQATGTRQTQRQSESRKRSRATGQQNGETKKSKQSNNKDNDASTNDNNINSSHDTPCNSSESEDDLPAVSISQTPTKGFSSLKDVKSKEFVWVKHQRDPFWPALAMKDGTANSVAVKFFYYEGQEYRVKNKKKILPYFCTEKEKFEEKHLHNANLREACDEALWLLRSEKKECGNTATEMFEAVEKRRSLSQCTPRKRMTYTTDEGSDSSSEDEPKESAFGYDITNNTNMRANDTNEGVDEESPKNVVSRFPKGSPYSYEILKENFTVLEPELHKIFNGEIHSENHRIYFQGSSKERNKIQVHNRCGPLYYLHTEHYNDLQDMMAKWVKNWSDNPIHEVKYVSDVLFPEATVRTIMKVEKLEKEDAWKKFLSLDAIE